MCAVHTLCTNLGLMFKVCVEAGICSLIPYIHRKWECVFTVPLWFLDNVALKEDGAWLAGLARAENHGDSGNGGRPATWLCQYKIGHRRLYCGVSNRSVRNADVDRVNLPAHYANCTTVTAQPRTVSWHWPSSKQCDGDEPAPNSVTAQQKTVSVLALAQLKTCPASQAPGQ
jgi:hypothetical protein